MEMAVNECFKLSASFVRATIVLLLLQATTGSDGSRVLLVPGNMDSHILLFCRLGAGLARLGHDVRVVAPSNARVPDFVVGRQRQRLRSKFDGAEDAWFNYTTYEVDDDVPYANSPEHNGLVMEAAMTRMGWRRTAMTVALTKKLFDRWEDEGIRLVKNETVMSEMRSAQFQFVVIEPVAPFYGIPQAIGNGVPFGILSLPALSSMLRVPRLGSFTPVMFADTTDRMSYVDRLFNVVGELFFTLLLLIFPPEVVSNNSSERVTVRDALRNISLWFLVEEPAVGLPMPLMPNTVPVGDIVADHESRPLPADLESFVAGSSDGVIVLSFGSHIDNIPEDINAKFCDAFRRLPSGRRVVWKLKNSPMCPEIDRVKVVKWIPQNDLLADKRVRLFITHGGFNSIIEAIYHGKPMIMFPIFNDQPANAAIAVVKGYGIRMDIADFTADSLLDNIDKILSTDNFRMKAELASAIFHDRRQTAAERVSDAINHVIKYGDRHLRTGALELNLLEFLMFDLFAVLFLALLTFIVLGCLTCRCICSKLLRQFREMPPPSKFKSD